MTLEDYMNSGSFPTTSQKGLSPEDQLRIDAFNLDSLMEFIQDQGKMNAKQIEAYRELKTKEPHMVRLTQELRAAATQ